MPPPPGSAYCDESLAEGTAELILGELQEKRNDQVFLVTQVLDQHIVVADQCIDQGGGG